jgi:hypothetical protein
MNYVEVSTQFFTFQLFDELLGFVPKYSQIRPAKTEADRILPAGAEVT